MIVDCNKTTTTLVIFHIVVTFELVIQNCGGKYCVHFIIFPFIVFSVSDNRTEPLYD